jgi:hypothetical protein
MLLGDIFSSICPVGSQSSIIFITKYINRYADGRMYSFAGWANWVFRVCCNHIEPS